MLVQEFTFSPKGANYECESLSLDLLNVTHLRLTDRPGTIHSPTCGLTLSTYHPRVMDMHHLRLDDRVPPSQARDFPVLTDTQ